MNPNYLTTMEPIDPTFNEKETAMYLEQHILGMAGGHDAPYNDRVEAMHLIVGGLINAGWNLTCYDGDWNHSVYDYRNGRGAGKGTALIYVYAKKRKGKQFDTTVRLHNSLMDDDNETD